MTTVAKHGFRIDPSDLHPKTSVAWCADCVPGFYARSWAYLARSDAEWHNTATGHDVFTVDADGAVEALGDDGWTDRPWIAHDRDETDSCQCGTPGCCVNHDHAMAPDRCETW